MVAVLSLFISEFSKENLTSHNRVVYKTWKMLISRCCFAEDGEETNELVFYACSFTVLSVSAIGEYVYIKQLDYELEISIA